jgi:hypothetical protein
MTKESKDERVIELLKIMTEIMLQFNKFKEKFKIENLLILILALLPKSSKKTEEKKLILLNESEREQIKDILIQEV